MSQINTAYKTVKGFAQPYGESNRPTKRHEESAALWAL